MLVSVDGMRGEVQLRPGSEDVERFEELQRANKAGMPRSSQRPALELTDGYGLRAQGHRLDHIRAADKAAIDHDLSLTLGCGNDLRQPTLRTGGPRSHRVRSPT